MKKEITIEEAKKVLQEYPSQDSYIMAHFRQFLNWGEYDDNSIELADYWDKCKKLVSNLTADKT